MAVVIHGGAEGRGGCGTCFYCSMGMPASCEDNRMGMESSSTESLTARVDLPPGRWEKIGMEVTEVVLRNVLEQKAEELERRRVESAGEALGEFDQMLTPVGESSMEN